MDLDKLEKLAEDLKLGYFTFQIFELGRDLSKLISVARAAENLGCYANSDCLGHGFIAIERALEELERAEWSKRMKGNERLKLVEECENCNGEDFFTHKINELICQKCASCGNETNERERGDF